MKRVCKDCGTEFEIEAKEEAWYKSKGFSLPMRCKSCRDKRKNANKEKEAKS